MNDGYFLGISAKQLKRRALLAVTFALLVLQMVFSSQVQAAQSGDYTYTVTDGKAKITKYTGTGGVVTVPSTLGGFPVTRIDDFAYYGCTGLTQINIPQSVISIGDFVFEYCTNLNSINIPESVTSIGYSVFAECPGLKSINIPEGVTSIGYGLFDGCTGLASVNIPEGVTSIGDYAFRNCKGLTSINIPQKVKRIGYRAFLFCTGLKSINFPDIFPEGLTIIGDSSFAGCTGLSSINIPEGVTSIERMAFDGCTGLTNIYITQGVTNIDGMAFSRCTGLTSITVDAGNLNYKSINGVLFNKTGTHLVTCPGGLASVNIPEGVTSIGDYAFNENKSLTSVSVPQSLTSIGNYTFNQCTGLTRINIPQGVTSIGNYAFDNCKSLTSINIPQGLTRIGVATFGGCRGLTTLDIPQNIKSVASMAFGGCSSLNTIRFFSSTTQIYDESYTIPDTTKIIGYDPSTAKDYANKYYRLFEALPITLQSIGITKPANKLVYTVGDPLDITGLDVTGTYSDGSTKIEPITTANISGFDSSKPATDQVLTITVGAKTTNYKVQIVAAPVSVTGVSLNKSTTAIIVGANETLTAIIAPTNATNKDVTWKSSNLAVATVDTNGKVVGLKAGTSDISVTTVDGSKVATCTVTVEMPQTIKVIKVNLNKKATSINVGANETLIASINPTTATNQNVTWKSSKTSVATVDSNGKVEAIKAGTATITVTTVDGKKTATCKVTVKSPPTIKVTKVSLNKKVTTINIGANETLIPTVSPTTATNHNVTWKSSNAKIATVDPNGVVKGIKAGRVTITVTTVDGKKTAKCTVTVTTIKR